MVFQAVAEYMTKAGKVKDIDLNVDIDIAGRSQVIKWSFSKGNALLTRTDKVRTYAHISLFVTHKKCKPIVHDPRTQSSQTFGSLESHFSVRMLWCEHGSLRKGTRQPASQRGKEKCMLEKVN